jgi:4-hydroxythreonine-4-phosphate dehydrogenase
MPGMIAVTCGDPAGIGPEVVAKALAARPGLAARVFGPPGLFEGLSERLGVPAPALEPSGVRKGAAWTPSRESGRVALAAIDAALEAVRAGRAAALVTAPVSKEWIHASGTPFTGHTEYLAAKVGAKETTMMFVSESLKVSLATTHAPLREVPLRLTVEGISKTVRQTSEAMRDLFGVGSPRIAVAGLNPHAGEGGLLGREELELIVPAIEEARRGGVDCRGPFAGDTVFRRALAGEFDAVVAMYHDQGLAAVKTVAPGAVNLTLGLPFIRTSPDHGTAFDIAGSGRADEGGMVAALDLAARLSERNPTLV